MQRPSLTRSFTISAAGLATAALTACAGGMSRQSSASMQAPSASAELLSTTGNKAHGTVRFTQEGDKLRIQGEVMGLAPNASHGFHVHEKGDCSSGDGTSAGGHFNPHNEPHGMSMGAQHHTGDLPSLMANGKGSAQIDVKITGARVGSGKDDIVGRGLIVHADPDDFMTQPTGNAGARVACAVIKRS